MSSARCRGTLSKKFQVRTSTFCDFKNQNDKTLHKPSGTAMIGRRNFSASFSADKKTRNRRSYPEYLGLVAFGSEI